MHAFKKKKDLLYWLIYLRSFIHFIFNRSNSCYFELMWFAFYKIQRVANYDKKEQINVNLDFFFNLTKNFSKDF